MVGSGPKIRVEIDASDVVPVRAVSQMLLVYCAYSCFTACPCLACPLGLTARESARIRRDESVPLQSLSRLESSGGQVEVIVVRNIDFGTKTFKT